MYMANYISITQSATSFWITESLAIWIKGVWIYMQGCTVSHNYLSLAQELVSSHSLQLIGLAHHISRGKLQGRIYTDSWPEFSAVVCQTSTSPGLPCVVSTKLHNLVPPA